MRSTVSIAIKIIVLIISLYLITKYIGSPEWDCEKKCILPIAGRFFAVYTLVTFVLLYCERTRHLALNTLKLYVPAFFILYSGLYYIDTTQHEQNINIKKEYIAFKLQYASSETRIVPKQQLDEIIGNHMKEYNSAFEAYIKVLNEYKTVIGKAMIGLTIGVTVFLIMELSKMMLKENSAVT